VPPANRPIQKNRDSRISRYRSRSGLEGFWVPSRGRSRYAIAALAATEVAMTKPKAANRPTRVSSIVLKTDP
jgi:hypothetical protein